MTRRHWGEAAIGGVAIAVACAWLAYVFLRFGPIDVAGGIWADYFAWGLDYQAYLDAAAQLAAEGTPYALEVTAGPYESGPTGLYYYSPVLAVALLPAVDVPWTASSILWFVAHVLALGAACALMPVRPLTRALAFLVVALTLPVFKDTVYGNVSTLLLLPMVMSWRWLDRPLGSIALAVGITIRPSLGLILIWQGLRRRWRALAWTVGAGLVLIALTLPFTGIGGYLDYLDALRNLNVPSTLGEGWENRDLGAVAMSLGAGTELVGFVRLGSIGLGVAAVLMSLRRDRETSYMVTLMATLIVVPILWDHYLAMLVIPAAFLADRWRPVALLLPLLSWLPVFSVFAVLLVILLLFVVPERRPETEPEAQGVPA
ncbi:MAG: glycosyltransferase family 87 protein [Chloroflexota bacterium]|nr:glycosyltransferase family 87 protein [Chloroflexota bacterium]